MPNRSTSCSPPFHADDIAVWPDGVWAHLGEVRNGEFAHKSDDFEIVRIEDHARLKELGLAYELDIV